MDIKIGTKLRQIRHQKGLSQENIADELGISQKTYSKIELNQAALNVERLTQIAAIFEMEPWELLAPEGSFTSHNHNQQGGNASSLVISDTTEQLIAVYESKIQHLKDEILFLRKLVERK